MSETDGLAHTGITFTYYRIDYALVRALVPTDLGAMGGIAVGRQVTAGGR